MRKIKKILSVLLICCMFFVFSPVADAVAISDPVVTETGTVGEGGAPWRLYSDGTLVVEAGVIDMTGLARPWEVDVDRINRIVFTGPIIAGSSLERLFRSSWARTIEGLGYFDTSNVTNMQSMFSNTSNLANLDLSGFDTGNVKRMSGMFSGSGITNLDLSSFDTSNVTDMSWMFDSARNLTSIDLSSFDTSNVTNMGFMFQHTSRLTSLDLSGFDTSNVTKMFRMFAGTSNLTSLDLSGFNTSGVTSLWGMFSWSGITNLDLSSFDTSGVTGMSWMFEGARNLTSLDLSNFDTSNVVCMMSMFDGTRSLTSLDLSNFDTSNVKDMSYMFRGAGSLTYLNVSSFDTSNVRFMGGMFSGTNSLRSLDISNFDTSDVTNMSSIFRDASSLTTLDLSNFNTSNTRYMGSMFRGATSLNQIILGENFHFNAERFDWNRMRIRFYDMPRMPTIEYHHHCISHAHLIPGYWQNVGDGTNDEPKGDFTLTSRQLMAKFDGKAMADAWVLLSAFDFKIPFTDIDLPKDHPMRQAVWYLYQNNIMLGTSATTFSPDENLSRAMVVTILHRLAGLPETTFEQSFDDVREGQWYSDAIVWAVQNNIVQGFGDGRFAPNDNLTTEQFVTMLHRFAVLRGYNITVIGSPTVLSFIETSEWALEGITWAVYNNLIEPDMFVLVEPNRFFSSRLPTRADTAKILERFMFLN